MAGSDVDKLTSEGQIGHRDIAVDSRLFEELIGNAYEDLEERLFKHALVSGQRFRYHDSNASLCAVARKNGKELI